MTSSPVQKPVPILKLPPEIRNDIWRYTVVSDRALVYRERMIFAKSPETGLRIGKPSKVRIKDDEPRQTSLLAVAFTCRQIYKEVTPIYYGENIFRSDLFTTFITGSGKELQSFVDAIGPANASAITKLHLYNMLWPPLETYLSILPNVKLVYFYDRLPNLATPSAVTVFAKAHTEVTVVYDGEVWGPEKWRMHPE